MWHGMVGMVVAPQRLRTTITVVVRPAYVTINPWAAQTSSHNARRCSAIAVHNCKSLSIILAGGFHQSCFYTSQTTTTIPVKERAFLIVRRICQPLSLWTTTTTSTSLRHSPSRNNNNNFFCRHAQEKRWRGQCVQESLAKEKTKHY